MLKGLIDLCLAHRPVVLLAAAALALAGVVSLEQLPLDAFPDTTPVQVQVNASAPALSALEVERQITVPLEQVISGLPGLSGVRSLSKYGFAQVTATFEDGTDVYLARQVVAERVAAVALPAGVPRPTLGPVATGLGEVFQYVLRSDTLTPEELRTLHHWVVRPQLLQVPGVAEVNTWGGAERQYHVVVEPSRLVKHDLTLDDLARVLSQSSRNAGGGVLEVGGEAVAIQGQGLVHGLAELEGVVVATADGTPIRLRDVAEVRVGHELRRGAVTYQGGGEVVLGLGFMLVGENSRALTQRLEARLREVQPSLPDEAKLEVVYSRTLLVDQVLETVRDNLLEGALLVVAVLFMFLGDLRAGLIVASAIPLSMLFAFNAMLRFGVAGSLMSLGAIDFGLVVDSSVIMVENAARRVEEAPPGRSVLEVVRDAALEVRRPTLFGELIIAVVYLPVLTLEGVEGKLFRPMALTVIFALAGSMLLSLTVMPVLASYLLRRRDRRGEGRLVEALGRLYRPVLAWALARRGRVLGLAGLAVLNAALLAADLGAEFVPRLQEQAVVVNTVRMAGIALDESVRYGGGIERLLLDQFPDELEHVWTRTGTAEVATDPMGLEVSDVFITLRPRASWTRARTQDELVEQLRAAVQGLPGMRSAFTQPIEMRVNEMLAGVRADVGVRLFGDDLEVLAQQADALRVALAALPGATDVTVEQLTGQAMLTVTVDREAAGRYGVPVAAVLDLVESLGTRKVGEVLEGQRRVDLVLRLDDEVRASPARLGQAILRTEAGAQVPLSAVAELALVEGPSTVQREWGRRRVVVQANVRGRDLAGFVEDVRGAAEALELPPGYSFTLGGQFESLERAQARLQLVVPLAILLVFALLYLTYGRAADALRVFTGVPFGAVGGVVLLWLRDMPYSISAGVGFIALAGWRCWGTWCWSPTSSASSEGAWPWRPRSGRRPRPGCGRC
jgi:cobalt-zinc-cadmium resistance protein CzcA